jgi:hypothetical protein
VITLTLRSSQPPVVILDALRAHAGEWRASHIPDVLRRSGILAVECKVAGNACTLAYRRRWYAGINRGAPLRLRAGINPDPQGGTTVRVSVSHEAYWQLTALLGAFFIIGGVTLLRFSLWLVAGLWFAVTGLNYALVRHANLGLTRRSDAEAAYLLYRIENAVADANSASAVAPAS